MDPRINQLRVCGNEYLVATTCREGGICHKRCVLDGDVTVVMIGVRVGLIDENDLRIRAFGTNINRDKVSQKVRICRFGEK